MKPDDHATLRWLIVTVGFVVVILALPLFPPTLLREGALVFELIKVLPTALVALLVAWISWRQLQVAAEQKRVAKAKFSFDLFEQRYEIFMHVWSVLSSCVQPRDDHRLLEADFYNARPRARFLFGDDITAYLDEVSSRLIRKGAYDRMTAGNNNVVPADIVHELNENELWLTTQAGGGARDRFGAYLDFGTWRPEP